ncbi:hypothetical protein GMOD_00005713 [Pyrenophora seminiperda CCB06]|uniref:Uncharacterized protein n=1 Tax=Pyrenophora seminiperda CCB06 TaxID=1302712 RepID=A0A3M7M9K6_9PLEO|nr:hypothetical protein GMOD_00005713 [Pyrenophora seminiperda CCB06]
MSNHNYISDMARAYNDLYGTACTLEEKLRESERNLGVLEWENEILRELLAGPETYNVAEEDGGGDVDCGTCKEEEEGSPIAVVLSQNPYVDCEGRNIKGEIWSSRADDGRHSPNTSPASGFEHQKPMTTTKSNSETSEVDKKSFQRSNAPSPDENCYREQHGEAARERGRADFRQIQTEMAILDLIALVEKLEDRMDVLGREVDGSDVGLRGGMGARDEEEEFLYDYGGYTNWDEVEAQQQKEKAQQQASKEKPKPVSSDGGIQKPVLLNVGLSEDSKSINGTSTTLLQTRNQFLESELQAFKEMNDSLVQDRNWQMSMQIELEERLEAVEAERDDIFCELRTLRKRCERLMESTGEEASDEDKRLSDEKMRGGNEESKLVSTKERKAEGGVSLDSLHPSPIYSRSLDCTNESLPSFASSSAGNAMSFEFFPEVSTIVIGSDPPHIYQFPHEFTLPQIRELLEPVDFKEEIEGERYVLRILEIMRIREDMGVKLPNTLREERVSIGIPDVSNLVFLNNDSKLEAWQTFDTDAKSLGTLVQQSVIGSSSATGVREALPKASSSDGDVYENISTLINSLNELEVDSNSCGTDTAVFCTCTLCTQSGRETYFNIRDMQPSPTLNVRGGDDMYGDSITQPSSPGSPHLSPVLSPSPSLASRARLIFSSRCSTGTVAPKALVLSSEHEIANAKEPLSIRLGDFLFPASLVRDRENSIRHFNWRDIKRMNPQCKNKCSKGFRYKKHPRCEGWASQLDRHREFCDYCQAMFIEEEYEKMRESEVENVRHEYDASIPFSEIEKPWKKSTWPDDTHKSPFPVVQEPDPRLRGGAGHEHEMGGEEEDPEDWKSEWNYLATQAQGTKHLSRTFRNSSTLSTNSLYQPIEPIIRDFGSKWRLIDGYGHRFDAGDGDIHQSCEDVLGQGCLEIIGAEGTNWRVPSLAGPVDLVQEAVTWLLWQAETRKRELDSLGA